MVGNSVRSDILPALAIGARAIHIPYYTTWVHERAEVPAELHERLRTLHSMAELEGVLAATLMSQRSPVNRSDSASGASTVECTRM